MGVGAELVQQQWVLQRGQLWGRLGGLKVFVQDLRVRLCLWAWSSRVMDPGPTRWQ